MDNSRLTPQQKKRVIASALLLAATALGIYLTVVMKFFVYG